MLCLTDPIRLLRHYAPPPQCAVCPHATGATCHRETVMVAEDVAYDDGTVILAGYCTDGASIPRFFWRVIDHPFAANVFRAALWHDAHYHAHYLTREQADEGFRELLLADGVGTIKADTMYRAVRWFGAGAWEHLDEVVEYSRRFVKYIKIAA